MAFQRRVVRNLLGPPWRGVFFVGVGAQGLPDAKTLEEAKQIARDHWATRPAA